MGGVSFFKGPGASFNTIFFSHLFSVISPDNLSPHQGLSSTWVDSSDKLSGDVKPREKISQTVCHKKVELVPLELFWHSSSLIHLTSV